MDVKGFTYTILSADRQVVTGVSHRRASVVEDLARRLARLRFSPIAVAIVEHRWAEARWRDKSLGTNAAALVKLIACGPVACVDWANLTPIDRPTFTDRWLRTVGCGMAYGPRLGRPYLDRVDPMHFALHDDVLALFDADCEIRHNYIEEEDGGYFGCPTATGATFETCFVLRDQKLTGVFVFGEED